MPPLKQGSSRAIFIPARLESTRLPRKMLLPCGPDNKPLICVTAENALRVTASTDVYVLTDSAEILATVSNHYSSNIPFRFVNTDPAPNGTARCFNAIRQLNKVGIFYEHIAILQGDVPNIDPSVIPLVWSNSRRVTTLVTDLGINLDLDKPNVVKAICAKRITGPCTGDFDQCYYFTRSPVPYAMKHVGIYGLNSSSLIRDIADGRLRIFDGPPCYIAEQENLEQLNWIAAGYTISASYIRREQAGVAIDTQADYDNYCNTVAK